MTLPTIAADTTAARANAEVVLAFFARVLGPTHETSAVPLFLAPTFVDHDPAAGDSGVSGVAAKLEGLWGLLPHAFYEADAVIAAGDVVAVASRLVIPASGTAAAVEVAFSDRYRVADALITEHWHVVDTAALGTALGAATGATPSS